MILVLHKNKTMRGNVKHFHPSPPSRNSVVWRKASQIVTLLKYNYRFKEMNINSETQPEYHEGPVHLKEENHVRRTSVNLTNVERGKDLGGRGGEIIVRHW